MTLESYLFRSFFLAFLVAAASILLLVLVFQIESSFGHAELTASEAVSLAILILPSKFYEVLPFTFIGCAVLAAFLLSTTNELTGARTAGASDVRLAATAGIFALLLGTLCVAGLNPISAIGLNAYTNIFNNLRQGPAAVFLTGSERIWMRQATEDGQMVMTADRLTDGQRFTDSEFFRFAEDGKLIARYHAREAILGPEGWNLSTVRLWRVDSDARYRPLLIETRESLSVAADSDPAEIQRQLDAPNRVSVWSMGPFIRNLNEAGFNSLHYSAFLHSELAKPFLLGAITMLCFALTLRGHRLRGLGMMMSSAAILGMSMIAIDRFATILGESGRVPIVLAAWIPPLATLMTALVILLYSEES